MLRALAFGTLLVGCLTVSAPCDATSLKDVKVGVRVFDFVTNLPRGKTNLGIIYDPQRRDSADDAQSILNWFASGAVDNRMGLVPELVDVRRLSEVPGLRAAILADGNEPYFDVIFDYARKNGTLTISSDLACVRDGKCSVGVSSQPRVEVIVSQKASVSCGIQYSEAFRMMVTEY